MNDFSSRLIGFFHYRWGGKGRHMPYLSEQTDERGKVRLAVLKRVEIAFRRLLDEILIEVLPADAFVREPRVLGLCTLGKP